MKFSPELLEGLPFSEEAELVREVIKILVFRGSIRWPNRLIDHDSAVAGIVLEVGQS